MNGNSGLINLPFIVNTTFQKELKSALYDVKAIVIGMPKSSVEEVNYICINQLVIMSDKTVMYLFLFLSLFPALLCYFSIKEVDKIKHQRDQLNEIGIESHANISSLEKERTLDFTPTNFGSPIRKTRYMMRCTYFNSDKPIQFDISFAEAFEAAQRGEEYVSKTQDRGPSSYEVVYFSLTEKEYKTLREGEKIPIKYIYGQPDSATRIDKDGNFRTPNIGWTIYLWGFLFVACLVLSFLYSKGIRV